MTKNIKKINIIEITTMIGVKIIENINMIKIKIINIIKILKSIIDQTNIKDLDLVQGKIHTIKKIKNTQVQNIAKIIKTKRIDIHMNLNHILNDLIIKKKIINQNKKKMRQIKKVSTKIKIYHLI